MARIRTIKPDFWTDEKIVQLPYEARLMFIGMWNFADDYGYVWDEPERIRLQVFPGDDIDSELIIDLLVSAELIERIANEEFSKFALKICKFSEHQKVDRPTESKIAREVSRKIAINSATRRAVALKYGAIPGQVTECTCYYCGLPGEIHWSQTTKGRPGAWVAFSHEIDHAVPESQGGEGVVENLVLACRECNRSKGSIGFAEFVNISRESSTSTRDGREGKGKEGNILLLPNGSSCPQQQEISDCPHQEIIKAYAKHLPMGIYPKSWNGERASKLRARWREESKRQSIAWWDKFFSYCSKSDFLTGKVHSKDRAPFEISLDWIVSPKNFANIIDGKYHKEAVA